MNQIPNIKETHNTEVERIVEEYYMMFCHSVDTVPFHSTNTAIGELDWLRTTLHHQLQKAREDGYNAGLADGTDKPLLAIEQGLQKAREEEYARGWADGAAGVACKNLNRDFIGIELDKEYFEIATKRINSIPNT